jgi:hypothetical protein
MDDFEITTRRPVYGPQGQTYRLLAYWSDTVLSEWYWTEREAQDRRVELYDDGWEQVRIEGLPGIYDASAD